MTAAMRTVLASIAFAAPIAPGSVVFVAMRPPMPEGSGAVPVAIDKLTWGDGTALAFSLGRDHTVLAENAGFTVPAVIQARVDTDGDARTRQPTDRVGEASVVVPSGGVVIRIGAAP